MTNTSTMPCSMCKETGHNKKTCPVWTRTCSVMNIQPAVQPAVKPAVQPAVQPAVKPAVKEAEPKKVTLDDEFHLLCVSGNLEGAQEFLRKNQINENQQWGYGETTIMEVCKNRHIHVADWLTDIDSKLSLTKWAPKAFLCACQQGDLNMARWLDEAFIIDIDMDDDAPFKAALKSNIKLAKWIQRRMPRRYTIIYDESGRCIDYSINKTSMNYYV